MNLILETARLYLRQLTTNDAAFIMDLLNQPSFIQFIGDRGIRTLADAHAYLIDGPLTSYAINGFGLYLVTLKANKVPIGMCGLIKRDGLDDVDIGYALLPTYWGKGYAAEAAKAVYTYGKDTLNLDRIVGITLADNISSIRVLENLGLHFEKMITLPGDDEEVMLFG